MKWRRIPAPPPPEVLIEERVGPHLVIVERHETPSAYFFRAVQIVGKSRALLAVSSSPDDALATAARSLGYEPDEEPTC
jgi:hypothetical protein